jgi:hypothetical protein
MEGGVYRNPHELYVDPTVDIRETDKLVIDSVTYYVKTVFTGSFGGRAHKRATVSTE